LHPKCKVLKKVLNVWDFSRRITDGQKMPVENRPLRAADSNPLSETKTFVAVGFSESDRVKNGSAILRKKTSPFQFRQQKERLISCSISCICTKRQLLL
jgi:hypothetical protein